MDRLDRLSLWAVMLLIIASSALISHHMGEAKPEQALKQKMQIFNPVAQNEIAGRSVVIKNLMEGMNLDKAEILVNELIRKYPYEGEPHMLMGDIHMRKQELIQAVFEYKEAVDLNPDYLDKKTPLFQGKKLKIIVGEVLVDIEKRLETHPDDETMKHNRKIIYYLQRRIAGSCG